jgi:hypothetical protein
LSPHHPLLGNHDVSLDKEYFIRAGKSRFHRKVSTDAEIYSNECRDIVKQTNSYLEDNHIVLTFPHQKNYSDDPSTVRANQVEFYGSPWQPEFCDWAFNLDRGSPLQAKWDQISPSCDVLITHGPPLGYGDTLHPSGKKGGCADLLRTVQSRANPPRVHIFGHIHEDYGEYPILYVPTYLTCLVSLSR